MNQLQLQQGKTKKIGVKLYIYNNKVEMWIMLWIMDLMLAGEIADQRTGHLRLNDDNRTF